MAGDFLTGSARSSALQQPLDSNPNNRLLTGHPSSRSAPEIAQGSPKQQWLTEKDALDPDGEAVVARAGPTKLDLILNWLLQIFGITIAVLFGVFSILSYFAASQDLAVSQLANQVALLSMCLQGVSANKVCSLSLENEKYSKCSENSPTSGDFRALTY